MLEIAVCDDNIFQINALEDLLDTLGRQEAVLLETDAFESGESLLKEIKRGKRYDIIYLDIEMDGIDGLETAGRIREIDRMVQIVYVTSHEDYIEDCFDAVPSGYLLKPVDSYKFAKVFKRMLRVVGGQDQYYRFTYKNTHYKVLIRDILYFESEHRHVRIIWEGGSYCQYARMNDVVKGLGDNSKQFLRTHGSFLVNYNYILHMEAANVYLLDGTELPLSRRRRKEIEEKMVQMKRG